MSAFDVFAFIFVVVGIIVIAATVISHTFGFAVKVLPRVEWAVITDLNGRIEALGQGTHSLQPGWKEIDRVPTSIQESSENNEEVRTKNGVRLALDERLNFVAGIRMKQLPSPRGTRQCWFDIADPFKIDPEMVIRASTSIDPGKPTQAKSIHEQVKLAVDAACESVFGNYTDEELLSPSGAKKLMVPKVAIPGMTPKRATSVSELYGLLAEYIRRITNCSLENIGIGLISVSITNLRYFDLELQKNKESLRRKELAVEATIAVKRKLPGADKLSTRELLLIDDPTFSNVAAAQAEAEGKIGAAKAIQVGMTSIANALGKAADKIADRFGSGTPPPPP